jgi:hypothetical protein
MICRIRSGRKREEADSVENASGYSCIIEKDPSVFRCFSEGKRRRVGRDQ